MDKITAIEVQAKEWFDKSGGNSYFSAQIYLTHESGLTGTVKLPFQYGYDSQYEYSTLKALQENGFIPAEYDGALWRYCRENDIKLTSNKKDNYTLKQVKEFGS